MKSFLKQINETPGEFIYHVAVFVVGVFLAFLLGRSSVFNALLESSKAFYLLTSFVAGFFFTSMATVAPASVAIFKIASDGGSLALISIIGGFGAMLGDLFLFQMLKFSLVDDVAHYIESRSRGHLKRLLRIKMFSLAVIIVGAIIVASPLPDEIGLAMMGMTHVKRRIIMIISFALNTAGILIICLAARGSHYL